MTTIAVFGDLFIRTKILENALEEHLSLIIRDLSFLSEESDWPDLPFMYDQEVKEFVGDPEKIAFLAKDAEAIVTHVAPITELVIKKTKYLRIIGCCRGGPVNVNVKTATERKIPVVYTPGRNAQAVVEFTLGLILAECKGISRAHYALTNGIWRSDLYRYERASSELKGRTIGLIGFGIIGQMLVPYLRPFGMRILAYDPYVQAETFSALNVEQSDLQKVLKESDIVSLHLRVTPETIGMIGEKEFRLMKQGAYFINTARGQLVDYDALYRALKDEHLAGAGLDTFALEPPPGNWPLLHLSNVTLTPHIAGSSKETANRAAEIVAQDFANFYLGKLLKYCVNPQIFNI
jgi:D-3-phosphoglycerate dehydrogenase